MLQYHVFIKNYTESRCALEIKDFLVKMNAVPHVSGYETALVPVLTEAFSPYAECSVDKFGNFIAHKKGSGKGAKVMIMAHMDEIGMMVSAICDNGFVKFSRIGGVDARNMLAQEVIIHGHEKVYGVIGIKPPHLTTPAERNKAVQMHDIVIDTGYSKESLETRIRVGDIITFKQDIGEMQNGKLTGKSLDNIAGVVAMYEAVKNLEHFNHNADVYFVASAQEEVGGRGSETITYVLKPDIGIAVDVTFGKTAGLSDFDAFELGKGPTITYSPNCTRKLSNDLKKVAQDKKIPFNIEVCHGMTGTDAAEFQVAEGGVITGVLSIPLKYMHSTVETLVPSDIATCGRLISEYIMTLQNWEEEA